MLCFVSGVDIRVRLANGTRPSEGRLEVYYINKWMTVCADNFTLNDAKVACKSMGYDVG